MAEKIVLTQITKLCFELNKLLDMWTTSQFKKKKTLLSTTRCFVFKTTTKRKHMKKYMQLDWRENNVVIGSDSAITLMMELNRKFKIIINNKLKSLMKQVNNTYSDDKFQQGNVSLRSNRIIILQMTIKTTKVETDEECLSGWCDWEKNQWPLSW